MVVEPHEGVGTRGEKLRWCGAKDWEIGLLICLGLSTWQLVERKSSQRACGSCLAGVVKQVLVVAEPNESVETEETGVVRRGEG